jgi:mannose-1-phosphate guanylyltransferase
MGEQHRGVLDLALSLDIPPSVSIMPLWNDQKNKMVSAQFEWSDLGSFESVYDYLKQLVIPWISTAIWLWNQ